MCILDKVLSREKTETDLFIRALIPENKSVPIEHQLPKDTGSGEAYSSLGYIRPGQNDLNFPIGSVNARVNLFNLKNWLTTEARQYLLSGIDDVLIDDLVTKSDEF